MKITTKFDVLQEVKIIPLNANGIIESISINSKSNTQYYVRYFSNNSITYCNFYENELEFKQEKSKMTFNNEKS